MCVCMRKRWEGGRERMGGSEGEGERRGRGTFRFARFYYNNLTITVVLTFIIFVS